jgi:hypothetical protein
MASNYPGNDLSLGQSCGFEKPLTLTRRDRARHTYIVGATRTGKTKLIEGMVRQDIVAWPRWRCPVVVIDPHGTLYESLMQFVAAENLTRLPIIPVDLRNKHVIVSYNLLRRREGADAAVIVRSFVAAILHAWGQANSNETPRLATWLETLLMLAYERECTLAEALELIRNPDLRHLIAGEVEHVVARATLDSARRLRETEFQDRVESTLYRINRFLSTQIMRASLCQTGASLDMSRVLEEGSILLVTTSTEGTQVAEEDATTFGSVLLTDLWTAARRRGKREEGQVRPAYTYVDEFHNFVGPAVAKGLAEASGMGIHLTLAHQMPSQLTDQGDLGRAILNAVLANAKNKFVFQCSHPHDLEMLSLMLFRQHVDPMAIKDEIHATKVLNHALAYLPSFSSGTSMTRSDGTQSSHTDGRSSSHAEQWSHTESVSDSFSSSESTTEGESSGESRGYQDPPDYSRYQRDSVTESEGISSSTTVGSSESHSASSSDSRTAAVMTGESTADTAGISESTANGVNGSVSFSPMQIPVMGQELSSRTFSSIDEQLFTFMQKIDGLADRHCFVRLASMQLAVPMMTRTLKNPLTTVKWALSWTRKALEKLDFSMPLVEALARVEQRQKDFTAQILNQGVGEEPFDGKSVVAKVRGHIG